MSRIKTELVQEGMVVSADVKNIDNMLLIPSGSTLTARQIAILQAWGVTEVEVVAAGGDSDQDSLSKLSSEEVEKLSGEVCNMFWKNDAEDPVYQELFKIVLRRHAGRRNQRPA